MSGIPKDVKLFKAMDFSFDDSSGPLTAQLAAQIANDLISRDCKIGYSPNTQYNTDRWHGYCGSYTCYHWFKEPGDCIEAIIIERILRNNTTKGALK